MNPKYFIAFLFIASAAAAVKLIDPFHDAREGCRKRAGLTREQLASAKNPNHVEIAGDYLICFVNAIGIPVRHGLLDVDVTVKVVAPVVAPVIARPITECCNNQVRKSGVENLREQLVVFVQCLVQELPHEVLDATGYLQKPVFPRLNKYCRA